MPRFLVLPGDGIGPEISAVTIDVLKAADARFGLNIDFEIQDIGLKTLASQGTTLPASVMESAKTSDGVILGPISHLHYPSKDKGGINVSAAFRVGMDLFANVRPARTRPGLGRGHAPLDLVIMREATEGFYPDRNMFMGPAEFMPTPDVAISMRRITAHASTRIARASFELARLRRRKVTTVHKANTFIVTDGLWLRCVRDVAKEYPDVAHDEIIVDACAAILVRDPQRFDVLCATNFHADILSDLASELSGGLGLAGSTNENEKLCCAQAQHGSAPDIEGQDKANPCSLILSAAMLLEWHEKYRGNAAAGAAAKAINAAIDTLLLEPETRTIDLGGKLGTKAFGARVAAAL